MTDSPLIIHTRSEEETFALGEALGRLVRAGDILALEGELGAGKTRLVRGIAAGMGIPPGAVSSPTFVIVNEYPGPPPLVHADAYRLRGSDELESVGWERAADERAVTVVEWPSRIDEALTVMAEAGRPLCRIAIEIEGETARRFTIEPPEAWRGRGAMDELHALAAEEDDAAGAGAQVRCPTCGTHSPADGKFSPFCSERCRMADLGRWFSGQYTISREMTLDDLEEGADPGSGY